MKDLTEVSKGIQRSSSEESLGKRFLNSARATDGSLRACTLLPRRDHTALPLEARYQAGHWSPGLVEEGVPLETLTQMQHENY
jgi:hypothetical protein